MKSIQRFKELIVRFFRTKKETPLKIKTPEELEWDRIKTHYRLEHLDGRSLYYVQYLQRGTWWYLRNWDGEDYSLEPSRGNSIRITDPLHLDSVITRHQEWMKGGRYFLASQY